MKNFKQITTVCVLWIFSTASFFSNLHAEDAKDTRPVVTFGIMEMKPFGFKNPDTGKADGYYFGIGKWLQENFPAYNFTYDLMPLPRLSMKMQNNEIQLLIQPMDPGGDCCVKVLFGTASFMLVSKTAAPPIAAGTKMKVGVLIGHEDLFAKAKLQDVEVMYVKTPEQLIKMLEKDRVNKLFSPNMMFFSTLHSDEAKGLFDIKKDLKFEELDKKKTYFYIRKDSPFAAEASKLQDLMCKQYTKENEDARVGRWLIFNYVPDARLAPTYRSSYIEMGKQCGFDPIPIIGKEAN